MRNRAAHRKARLIWSERSLKSAKQKTRNTTFPSLNAPVGHSTYTLPAMKNGLAGSRRSRAASMPRRRYVAPTLLSFSWSVYSRVGSRCWPTSKPGECDTVCCACCLQKMTPSGLAARSRQFMFANQKHAISSFIAFLLIIALLSGRKIPALLCVCVCVCVCVDAAPFTR
jgi:hypothetical protein